MKYKKEKNLDLHTDFLEKKFGPVHAEVIEHSAEKRIVEIKDRKNSVRTFAVTFFSPIVQQNNFLKKSFDEMAGGELMGKILRKNGWQIEKNVLTDLDIAGHEAKIYQLIVEGHGMKVTYGIVGEIYHPRRSLATEEFMSKIKSFVQWPESPAQQHAFEIFQKAAQHCPAYKQFLKNQRCSIKSIKNFSQFTDVPIADKSNYFRQFPLEKKLYDDKEIADYYMLCTSTGSTGEPTIWLRDYHTDAGLEMLHTDFLNEHFQITKKKTLIVISFGLGANTAGMLHAKLSWAATENQKISVITPGIDPEKTVFLIENLYKNYGQVVCIGYPPFISEFVDLAIQKKFPVKKWNLKIVFTSESVSAQWRNEMAKKISSRGEAKNIVAFYASTEAGIIGVETLETHGIMASCLKNEKFRLQLFHSFHLPTLVEVNFLRKFVEVVNEEVVLTIDQSIPLVRYNVHDRAIFLTTSQIKDAAQRAHVQYVKPQKEKVFLAVFGRNEGPTKDALFFIEDIKFALEKISKALRKKILTEFQYQENPKTLSIQLYVKNRQKISASEKRTLEELIQKQLQKIKMFDRRFAQKHFSVQLNIRLQPKRIGYKAGKLRYFL